MGAKIIKLKKFPEYKNKPTPLLIQNKKTGEKELWVRVFGDTVPEQFSINDYEGHKLWLDIKQKQSELKDYQDVKNIHFDLYNWHYMHGTSYKELIKLSKKRWNYIVKSPEDMGKIIYRVSKKVNPEKYMDKKLKKR